MKCFHLALLLSTTLGLAAADSPHERIGKAESELGAFRETKSPAALTSAYRNARDIAEVPNRETWEAHRRKKLELLLSALKEMDHAIDPKFDPERRPMSQPPLPAGAPLELNIGVSPSSIEDPKLRAEYEQAIEDHRSYARYYNAQIQFRELRRQCVQELGGFLNRAFSGKLRKQAETAIDAAGLTPAIKAEIQREAAKPLPKPPVYTSAEAQAKLEEFARAHEAKYLYEAESIALNLTSGVPERRRKALRMEQCRLMLLILEKGTAAMAGFNPDVRPSDSPPLPKIENFSPEKRAAIAKASAEERLAILQNEHESSLPAYRQEVAKFHQQLATHTALKQIKAVVLDFVKETFQREDPKQVEGLIEQCITDPATQQLLKATRETK